MAKRLDKLITDVTDAQDQPLPWERGPAREAMIDRRKQNPAADKKTGNSRR